MEKGIGMNIFHRYPESESESELIKRSRRVGCRGRVTKLVNNIIHHEKAVSTGCRIHRNCVFTVKRSRHVRPAYDRIDSPVFEPHIHGSSSSRSFPFTLRIHPPF